MTSGQRPATLTVERTWDGEPVPPEGHARVVVRLGRGGLEVRVEAPWRGDPAPEGPVGPTWGLWEHEVVEVFVLGEHDRYLEVELGPHGHHLVLVLNGRRNVVSREHRIEYVVQRRGDRWRGRARVPAMLVPPGPHRLNAYAVHGVGAARRYLAAHPVPGDAPDFHRLDCFEAAPWNPVGGDG